METLLLSWGMVVMQVLGLPGLIFIIWHFDNRRFQRQDAARKDEMQKILNQYREDITAIRQLYESNVRLVERGQENEKRMEKLYGETISVVSLNTQTFTNLTNAIQNNQYCPAVRRTGT